MLLTTLFRQQPSGRKPALSENRSSIQVIERMMALLDAIAESGEAVNLKYLAGQTSCILRPRTAFWV